MTDVNIREMAYGSYEYKNSLFLRNDVLRKPLGLNLFTEDLYVDENSHHIGAFTIYAELIGILVLTKINDFQIKMRQVAVNKIFRGQQVGRRMNEFAQEFSINKGFSEIIVHARESAVPFYEKVGFEKIGDAFIEVTIPHYKMLKKL